MASFLRARTQMARDPKTLVHLPSYLAMERIEEGHAIPTAATDGKRLWINVAWMEQWTVDQQIGVLAHECLHRMLKHHLRFQDLLPKARALYPSMGEADIHRIHNIACDIRINSDLLADGFDLPENGHFDKEGKFKGQSSERIFWALLRQEDEQGQGAAGQMPEWGTVDPLGAEDGQGDDGSGMAGLEERQAEEQEVDRLVATGLAMARKKGLEPGGLAEQIKRARRPRDWREDLLEELQRTIGADEFSMARLSNPGRRQGFVMPGTISQKLHKAAVALDTSGSISAKELGFYVGQVNEIVRSCAPEELVVIQCDAAVRDVRTLAEGEVITSITVKGRGGTSFVPVFDHLERDVVQPDVLVYMTDGQGTFPIDRGIPTIWLMTTDIRPPFGRAIRLNP
ncbi:hypothetical protein [Planktothrix phage Pra-JY27]|nr:VWA-like domain-containing protein [Planktothrix phage Pag-Yong1]WEV89252.1 VWA-like domain-containing protein [Synechococcus phage MinM2]